MNNRDGDFAAFVVAIIAFLIAGLVPAIFQ